MSLSTPTPLLSPAQRSHGDAETDWVAVSHILGILLPEPWSVINVPGEKKDVMYGLRLLGEYRNGMFGGAAAWCAYGPSLPGDFNLRERRERGV